MIFENLKKFDYINIDTFVTPWDRMMKKFKLLFLILISCIVLIVYGCFEFVFVNQPATGMIGQGIDVSVRIKVRVHPLGSGSPENLYFGMQLPDNWTVENNSFPYTGDQSGTITYDATASAMYESDNPATPSHFWWFGKSSSSITQIENDIINWDFTINHGDKTGSYFIDYVIASDGTSGEGNPAVVMLDDETHPIKIMDVIPTLPEWGAIILGSLILFFGGYYLFRRM